ncbi:MAG: dTDP-glucose 4,6-dehydratase [Deltaproteobacteria bacterium]|jgi:dTDP-glucose 4,6-dehydratase|nr:dTDP-glucose 4,6-dehydratase [Deltaproteobacteria bacterium]
MTVLVTGGAGFIGTNLVLTWLSDGFEKLVTLDKLTYAGNRRNLDGLSSEHHELVVGDIGDRELVACLFSQYRPRAIVNLAAESHVDRSIDGPGDFIETNVVGTFNLLEQTRRYFDSLGPQEAENFRFLHVSTDEVYGSLGPLEPAFTETTPYCPNSPYSASKAASDHLVRAYGHTYGLPTLTTNCSNNYGPYQFPEKLIPLMVLNGLAEKPLPVYGDGQQVRDWLFVTDHVRALKQVLENGEVGQTYNLGGEAEKSNLEVVSLVCTLLDELAPTGRPHANLIEHVRDRPGHDRRYAVNPGKARRTIGFAPSIIFEEGLKATVQWYLENRAWVASVQSGEYRNWIERQYGTLGSADKGRASR